MFATLYTRSQDWFTSTLESPIQSALLSNKVSLKQDPVKNCQLLTDAFASSK